MPSSTSVTSGDATCSPTRPVNTDASFAMWSASSPCPHASWNSTPPAPRRSTTGSLPGRRRHRVEQRDRAPGRGARDVLGIDLVEELEAERAAGRFVAGLHAGVAGRDALHHEPGAHLVVLGEEPVGVRDLDAAVGVGVRGRHRA